MSHRAFKRCIPALLALAAACASDVAFAWGAKGHRIIGALADAHLTAAARAAVAEILEGEDLATVSTWADEIRSRQDDREFWSNTTAPWHYVNVTPGADYVSSEKNPAGDAHMALDTFIAILRDDPIPAGPVRSGLESHYGDLATGNSDVKRFALKFLVHILGDLQQPLHSGYADDRGGNGVRLTWFGDATNLHTLWDTQLVEQQGLSYTEYTSRLAARIGRMPSVDIRAIERVPALGWTSEARAMLGDIYAAHATSTELGYDYADRFTPLVEAQLIKGGLRTAYVLNDIFGR